MASRHAVGVLSKDLEKQTFWGRSSIHLPLEILAVESRKLLASNCSGSAVPLMASWVLSEELYIFEPVQGLHTNPLV